MPADEALGLTCADAMIVDSSTLVIAIDGPSGSGKSTVARGVARQLGLRYLDTGAIYRALTWAVLAAGVVPGDAEAVADVAEHADVAVSTDPDTLATSVDGIDVTAPIRGDDVTTSVSAVSAIPQVRQRLVALQRSIIGRGGIVVEGRDIGTAVCPDAPVKVFLTASPDARAARRSAETARAEAAPAAAVAKVKNDLARRDALDSSRSTSPLASAADAVPIDATAMNADAVINVVLEIVAAKTGIAARASAHDQRGGERS